MGSRQCHAGEFRLLYIWKRDGRNLNIFIISIQDPTERIRITFDKVEDARRSRQSRTTNSRSMDQCLSQMLVSTIARITQRRVNLDCRTAVDQVSAFINPLIPVIRLGT